jgi:hypothetical protein
MSSKAGLEQDIRLLRSQYQELESKFPLDVIAQIGAAIHPRSEQLLQLLDEIMTTSKKVFYQLSAFTLHERKALVMMSDSDKTFLDEVIRLRFPQIRDLYIRYHPHGWFEDFLGTPDGSEIPHATQNISWTFHTALVSFDERIEEDDDRRQEIFDFPAATEMIQSPYFRPDTWWLNAKALEPVVQKERDARIPPSIRRRLEAAYASFFFENWLACAAMARATLEYALRSIAPSLGISLEPTGRDKRHVTFEDLIDRVADEAFPDSRDSMHKIRTRGNAVMHPSQDKRLENPTRESAFEIVSGLKECIERLFRNS